MLASLTATSMPQTGSTAVSVEMTTGAGAAVAGAGSAEVPSAVWPGLAVSVPATRGRATLDGISHPRRQVRQGDRDRRGAYDSDGRGREMRLQKDFQCAAAETGV